MEDLEPPRTGSIMESALSMRRMIRRDMGVRDRAKAHGISLRGRFSPDLTQEMDDAFDQIKSKYAVYLHSVLTNVISIIPNLKIEEIEEVYRAGLLTAVKQCRRLEIKTGEDATDIHTIAERYGIAFLRSLRYSARRGETARNTLTLARRVYSVPPDIIERLTATFPDLDPGMISRAALNYPSDPDAFLRKIGSITSEERICRIRGIAEGFALIRPTIILRADWRLYDYYTTFYRHEGRVDWLAILLHEFPDDIKLKFRHRDPAQSGFGAQQDDFCTPAPDIDFGRLEGEDGAQDPENILMAAQDASELEARSQHLSAAIHQLPPALKEAILAFYAGDIDLEDPILVEAIRALQEQLPMIIEGDRSQR